jgi:hypothetical protein
MSEVDLECFCGSLKGKLQVVSNKKSFHVHCLCKDCQNFASYLGNEDKILDEYGGSELFQTYPSYMKITEGKENLACIQLREKGIMRWYASCCNAPVANTMLSAKMPFIGLSVKMMKFTSKNEKQNTLGPVIMKAFGMSARGEKPVDAYDTFPKSFMPRIIKFMIVGYLGSKHKPSPFFSEKKSVCEPKILS